MRRESERHTEDNQKKRLYQQIQACQKAQNKRKREYERLIEECTTLKDKEIEDEMWPNEYAFIQQNFTSGCTQSQHVTQELKRVAKKARKIEGEVAVLKHWFPDLNHK